jgi:hypothetical protein
MAAKKNSRKKAAKNSVKKNTASTESRVTKTTPGPEPAVKPGTDTLIPEPDKPVGAMQDEITSPDETEITKSPAINVNCKCIQKKANGNFFCFRLVQGRWIQSSAIPFPTQELCEEANCDN